MNYSLSLVITLRLVIVIISVCISYLLFSTFPHFHISTFFIFFHSLFLLSPTGSGGSGGGGGGSYGGSASYGSGSQGSLRRYDGHIALLLFTFSPSHSFHSPPSIHIVHFAFLLITILSFVLFSFAFPHSPPIICHTPYTYQNINISLNIVTRHGLYSFSSFSLLTPRRQQLSVWRRQRRKRRRRVCASERQPRRQQE